MKKTIRKAFKFRLNLHSDQVQKLVEFTGANRFVWNKALAMNLFRLEHKQPILWYQEMAYWLGLWKQSDEYGFLKTVHSQTLQQTLKNLERAFKDGFDKTQPLKRIPKFKVSPQYTSQTCPCCGHIAKENRLTQSKFECVECSYIENADVVGAMNVLVRGHRILACGVETLVSTMKQEPVGSSDIYPLLTA